MTTTSFIMGVYNGARHLAATLDSILRQTDPDFELIVVDDGSTDDTPHILADCARRDARIRIITQPNAGLTRALIAGCAAARGRYIARHDAGDVSAPHRLQRQRALLDADETVVFISCWTEFVGPELEPLYDARGSGRATTPVEILDPAREHLVIDGPTCHPSVVMRRDAYERAGGYRPELYYGQDWDLWYRLAALGRFQMVEEVLYFARVTPESISAVAKAAQEEIAIHTHDGARARARGESDAVFLARAASVRRGERGLCARARGLYFIGEALRRKGDPRARKYLLRAALRCPLLVQAWIRLLQTLKNELPQRLPGDDQRNDEHDKDARRLGDRRP